MGFFSNSTVLLDVTGIWTWIHELYSFKSSKFLIGLSFYIFSRCTWKEMTCVYVWRNILIILVSDQCEKSKWKCTGIPEKFYLHIMRMKLTWGIEVRIFLFLEWNFYFSCFKKKTFFSQRKAGSFLLCSWGTIFKSEEWITQESCWVWTK